MAEPIYCAKYGQQCPEDRCFDELLNKYLVAHARWKRARRVGDTFTFRCSGCGAIHFIPRRKNWREAKVIVEETRPYCSFRHAKMDGGWRKEPPTIDVTSIHTELERLKGENKALLADLKAICEDTGDGCHLCKHYPCTPQSDHCQGWEWRGKGSHGNV